MWLTSIEAYSGLAKTRPPTPFPKDEHCAGDLPLQLQSLVGNGNSPSPRTGDFWQGQHPPATEPAGHPRATFRPFPLPGGRAEVPNARAEGSSTVSPVSASRHPRSLWSLVTSSVSTASTPKINSKR